MPTNNTTTSNDKLKQTADEIKKLANEGISYTYQFDWFSVTMMGLVGIVTVVIVTLIYWFLNRKT